MWALVVLTVAVAAAASEAVDDQEEKLVVARGKLMVSTQGEFHQMEGDGVMTGRVYSPQAPSVVG